MTQNPYVPSIPALHWDSIAAFVEAAAHDSAAQAPYAYKTLVRDIGRHVYWAWQTAGLPLDRSVIFHRDVIEEHVCVGCPELSPRSAGNRRSLLLRVAEAILPPAEKITRLAPLCNPTPSTPYTEAELTSLRTWANGQNTARRVRDCNTLLALGLGAGLSASEMKQLRVGDIHIDEHGAVLTITGKRPRLVPILHQWEGALSDLAENAPHEAWALGIERPTPAGRNSISNLVARSVGVGIKPNTHRMRATWLVNHLAWGTPVLPLMEAAGLATLEMLDRYMRFVPGVTDPAHGRALLRRRLTVTGSV